MPERKIRLAPVLGLLALLEHLVILHRLPPNNLTPSRLDLVGLRANLIHLGRNHILGSLVRLPLLH